MRRQGNVSHTFSPHVYPSQAVNGPLWLLVGQEQLCSLQVFIPHLLTPGGKGTCTLLMQNPRHLASFTAQALKLGEGNSCDIGYPFLGSPRARRNAPPIKPRSNTRPPQGCPHCMVSDSKFIIIVLRIVQR